MRYLNNHDVRMRLHGTYCSYLGQPVLVKIADDSSTLVHVYDLKTSACVGTVDSNDEEKLDIESLPLGYANVTSTAGYCQRIPYRQQKQGVSHDNTHYVQETWHVSRRHRHGVGSISSEFLLDMFLGKYPTFDQALHTLRKPNTESVAFHRRLAVVVNPKGQALAQLRYSGRTMGFYLLGAKKAVIANEFSDFSFRNLLTKLGVEHDILPQDEPGHATV